MRVSHRAHGYIDQQRRAQLKRYPWVNEDDNQRPNGLESVENRWEKRRKATENRTIGAPASVYATNALRRELFVVRVWSALGAKDSIAMCASILC